VLPSAVGIVDTRTDRLVRVMHTGPIPKFLAASPDGRWLAVIHWGDNSVGLVDIAAADPAQFRHAGEIVVERKLPLELNRHVDRDRYCGFCLRGAVFTSDSRHLLVGRMGGGGIAVLDVAGRATLGTVSGMPPTPRHLVLTADGKRLYVGSNVGGQVSLYRPEDLVAAARAGKPELAPLRAASTGSGTRTIALSPDGRWLFAAVNRESKLVVLDAETLAPKLEIAVDSYPVGLGVAPAGDAVWVTSQGVKLLGGNSVGVYRVEAK
jgi:DNA-binding beta-propeller fold protein YncE